MTNYDAPFLTSEQRVSRLFEINAIHYTEQQLILTLTQEGMNTDAARNALLLIRSFADQQRAKVEAKYRAIAIQNMVTRKVTTWVA